MTTTTTNRTAPIRRLANQLDGHVLLPGEAGYDEARTVWNAMVDRRPRAIVRCASVADVAAAVRTARELGLPIGVRCGGHGILGHAVPDGGIMIDLRLLDGVHVDPARRRAWVSGGAMLGALDRASQPHGLATTAGNVSHTGVGGLTLGGGMGWLARQYGLACDNVASYEVVTATGDVLLASPSSHPDLYWGLRGGGGNFGIVTRFEFRLHAVGTRALTADWTYPAEQAAAVLRGWRDLSAAAPRQATFTAGFGSDQRVTVGYVWVGEPDAGRRLLPALRSLGRAGGERVRELSYLRLQSRDDTPQGHALRRYWKGHYLRELSDGAISALIDAMSGDPADPMRPNASLQAYGGAIAEVPDEQSAFSHRGTAFEYVAASRWSDPAEDADRMAAARRYAAGLDPFASGAYVNALTDTDPAALRRAYPTRKLTRLSTIKHTYDPQNTFHQNHNIPPTPH